MSRPIRKKIYSFSVHLFRTGHVELEHVQLKSLICVGCVAHHETLLMRTTNFTWKVTWGISGALADLKSRVELGMLNGRVALSMLKGRAELDMLKGQVELYMLKSRAELGMVEIGILKGRAEHDEGSSSAC